MSNETKLTEEILKITNLIKDKYPELVKYISEIPVKLSYKDDKDPDLKSLTEYLNSLETILKKYANNHEGSIK